MKKLINLSFLVLGIFILLTNTSRADDSTTAPAKSVPDAVNCFDYYSFQSVQVSVGPDKDVYDAGEKVTFRGELINQNDYPIVDGSVFMRIGKKNPNYTKEGQFTIDEQLPLQNIVLDAKQTKETEFTWTAPAGLPSGDYRADFFFSVGKKFNLGGLPFTNVIIVGFADFTINSSNTDSVYLYKAGTKINGAKYDHVGSWTIIEPNAKAEITQPIRNTFNEQKTVHVQYDLYWWDSLNEKDKIDSRKEDITIPAGSSADLSYVIPQMKDSVYYLRITAQTDEQKSIVNIRLTSDQERARINFPAITKFPLQKGDSETLFSCFHNTGPSTTQGKLLVTLADRDGKTIDTLEYSGDIKGAMQAGKKEFAAQKNYDWMKLMANLYDKNGKIIDTYETVYDCQIINAEKCFPKTVIFGKKGVLLAVGMAVIILAIVLVIILILIKKKNE